jgi:hypothetical protein
MVSIRDEIAEAGREQDRLLAEHDQWMARRNTARTAPVSKTSSPGLTAPQPEPVPSSGDGSIFDTERDKRLAKAIGIVAAELRHELGTQILRLKKELVGDRVEMRRERALLYDEIKTLRRRIDIAEHGRVDELPRKARERAKRRHA